MTEFAVGDTSGDPGFQHPHASPADSQRKSTSGLAIASLVTGVLSPAFLCVCGLSLITSLVAIITGHISLIQIKRSPGRLSGRGIALTGTILGYLMFAISAIFLVNIVMNMQRDPEGAFATAARQGGGDDPVAKQRLRDIEAEVMTASTGGIATGNTDTAKELAQSYSQSVKLLRDAAFTADRDRIISLTEGEFITHCELTDAGCVFIVHVPSYRDFDREAKKALAQLAWAAAQETVSEVLEPGVPLAVGLRGTILYGAILIGSVAADDTEQEDYREGEREDLLPLLVPAAPDPTHAQDLDTPQPTGDAPPGEVDASAGTAAAPESN